MSEIFVQAQPRLIRTLSVAYTYQGHLTANDPSYYRGEERRLREDAILEQYPNSGYAERIRIERAANEHNAEEVNQMPHLRN